MWDPLRLKQRIGQQAYKLSLLENWKIHPVFHISLLKRWNTASLQEEEEVPADDDLELEEPYYEIEKILRWRKVKRGRKNFKGVLSAYGKDTQLQKPPGSRQSNFHTRTSLQQYLEDDQPLQEKV